MKQRDIKEERKPFPDSDARYVREVEKTLISRLQAN
jgi:hypothetical protein